MLRDEVTGSLFKAFFFFFIPRQTEARLFIYVFGFAE